MRLKVTIGIAVVEYRVNISHIDSVQLKEVNNCCWLFVLLRMPHKYYAENVIVRQIVNCLLQNELQVGTKPPILFLYFSNLSQANPILVAH